MHSKSINWFLYEGITGTEWVNIRTAFRLLIPVVYLKSKAAAGGVL